MQTTGQGFTQRTAVRSLAVIGALLVSTTGCAWLARSSVPSGPSAEWQSDGDAGSPALSGSGRYTAFSSRDDSLSSDDTNGGPDVFVRDNVLNTTELITVTPNGTATGGDIAAISDDGRYIAFASDSGTIARGDNDGVTDVFLRDRITGISSLVSLNNDETSITTRALLLDLSPDGRTVAFCLTTPVPVSTCARTAIRHVATGTTVVLPHLHSSQYGGGAALSRDGSRVGYTELFLNGPASTMSAAVADTLTGEILADLRTAPFAFQGQAAFKLDLSPDGTTYALAESHINVSGTVTIGRVDGSAPAVTRSYGWAADVRISDDNATIAVLTRIVGIAGFREVLAVDDGVAPLKVVSANASGDDAVSVYTQFDFSHDGRWVAFVTNENRIGGHPRDITYAVYTRSVAKSLVPPT